MHSIVDNNGLYPGLARQLRKIRISQLPGAIFKAPPNYKNEKIVCVCGNSYFPSWDAKLPFEYTEIQSQDGAVWGVTGIGLPCNKCGKENIFQFPVSELNSGKVDLFGDEAEQTFGSNARVYVYAFVGIWPTLASRVSSLLNDVKLKMRPSIKPSDWVFHVRDVRNIEWRQKNHVAMNTKEIDEQILRICDLLAENHSERFISITVFPPFTGLTVTSRSLSLLQESVLKAAIVSTTLALTTAGYTPSFTLESQTTVHRNNHIDWIVEKIGRSLRHDLGYLYISNGLRVGLPTTQPKGSSPELELADILAFMGRRFFHRNYLGRPSDLPLERLGEIMWGCFCSDRFGTKYSTGFPADYFFPNLTSS